MKTRTDRIAIITISSAIKTEKATMTRTAKQARIKNIALDFFFSMCTVTPKLLSYVKLYHKKFTREYIQKCKFYDIMLRL